MAASAQSNPGAPVARLPSRARGQALYLMLGFSAGLPFLMFSSVLAVRLTEHGVALAIIGFFAWVTLLPTFKFLWAPLLDRYGVPGFTRFWGKRRGWIMLSQLGIFSCLLGMALTSSDTSLAVTALLAVLLAFWTTTLEIAADAWRIELAPTAEEQAPLAAANIWGYRTAMVAAGSGALILADVDQIGWTGAYLAIAAAALIPFPILAAMGPDPDPSAGRSSALVGGLVAGAAIFLALAAIAAAVGWVLLEAAGGIGISSDTNVTPYVAALAALPFLLMAAALPKIRRLPPSAPARRSVAIGPYVDFFWRYGFMALALMAFVSIYRMGDVLALGLSKPMVLSLGYTKTQIGLADTWVALLASILGVGVGAWMAARWRQVWALAAGALFAAIGNFGFVWLAHQQPPTDLALYLATAADQFGNGMAGTVFVIYLALLVNPRFPGAQYAFLTGFAFLLPRLLAGAGGSMVQSFDEAGLPGWDMFFLISGAASLAALPLLPLIARARPREPDEVKVFA